MAKGRIITIGSFDGVHRGHAALLDFTVEAAEKRHLKSMALTFNMPPKIILNHKPFNELLSSIEEKKILIKCRGLDEVEVLRFSESVSDIKPFKFFRDILIDSYKACGIVVGTDFRFGAGRTAGAVELVQWGVEYEIPVWVISPVQWNGRVISSSRIREALIAHRLRAANNLLGHPYLIGGIVERGNARGRQLGFPTANVKVSDEKLLPQGVFVVTGSVTHQNQRAKRFRGVCNIGTRPTLFESSPRQVEVHLFGKIDSLVGKKMMVELQHRLRDEKKFNSPQNLIRAIRKDVKRAHIWFEKSS
jgi:riboflavin kinase / FMN adenylyltransferase